MDRFFFVHVMKTAGTDLTVHLLDQFDASVVWPPRPSGVLHQERDIARSDYVRPEGLLALDPEERRRLAFVGAHYPAAVADLLDLDLHRFTLLREPVDRTISFLKMCERLNPEHRGLELEAIYEDRFYLERFIRNHQTKVFSLTTEEVERSAAAAQPSGREQSRELAADLRRLGLSKQARGPVRIRRAFEAWRCPIAEVVAVDEDRLARARATLEGMDVVGVTEDYEAFRTGLARRFGWAFEARPPVNVGEDRHVSEALRRRIAEDNRIDLELYEHARALSGRA